jgi:hypothetical protein
MEEKEEKSAFKAAGLCRTFADSFMKISYTVHPAGIPGEAQGKSSNEAWAAQQIMKDYNNDPRKQDMIVTTMDGQYGSSYLEQLGLTPPFSRHPPLRPLLLSDRSHAQRLP